MAPGDPPKDDQYAELNAARAAKMQRKLMVPLIYGPLLPLSACPPPTRPKTSPKLFVAKPKPKHILTVWVGPSPQSCTTPEAA
jgi:hypothetical protein